ncbi:hypothetical protein [Streptomyces sp. A5-4]|uniref:hypothetical protein n=1 Tax=Streptomyces sp. A5-4 TaxID=3384771 RepID=UPI003DAA32B2
MLASRTAVWLKAPALTPDEVRWAILRFHQLWHTSDIQAVQMLDGRVCHGNFRRWAQATRHTLRLLPQRENPFVNPACVARETGCISSGGESWPLVAMDLGAG